MSNFGKRNYTGAPMAPQSRTEELRAELAALEAANPALAAKQAHGNFWIGIAVILALGVIGGLVWAAMATGSMEAAAPSGFKRCLDVIGDYAYCKANVNLAGEFRG